MPFSMPASWTRTQIQPQKLQKTLPTIKTCHSRYFLTNRPANFKVKPSMSKVKFELGELSIEISHKNTQNRPNPRKFSPEVVVFKKSLSKANFLNYIHLKSLKINSRNKKRFLGLSIS